jgi:hypothetical protein
MDNLLNKKAAVMQQPDGGITYTWIGQKFYQ